MTFARIVWDGEKLVVPPEMGTPRSDQLQGHPLEQLIELAGRVCYDSLGIGRNTVEYHKHINDVNHGSVQEHANLTFILTPHSKEALKYIDALVNRPGVWVYREHSDFNDNWSNPVCSIRLTINIRAIREWFKWGPTTAIGHGLGTHLQHLTSLICPIAFGDILTMSVGLPIELARPALDEELWVSLFFTNVSRGFSHELVRHKFRTAVSQRSTRFVDESETDWCWHPLIQKYVSLDNRSTTTGGSINDIKNLSQSAYSYITTIIKEKLIQARVDENMARKQARGAARGVLGNALGTELIFSASLAQWKWILKLRASKEADAEMRIVMSEVFDLLSERFPDRFSEYKKQPSPDGIGSCITCSY